MQNLHNLVSVGIKCHSLPFITNGTISFSNGYSNTSNMEVFDFGTEALYNCSAGYFLNDTGANIKRTCQDNNQLDTVGEWSGEAPTCVRELYLY